MVILSNTLQILITDNKLIHFQKATTADIKTMPGSRTGHSAVSCNLFITILFFFSFFLFLFQNIKVFLFFSLVDDKIFVYGGSYFNGDTSYDMPAKKTFVMLDTVNLVWSIPPLNDTKVPELAYHTATLLIDKAVMILTFGKLFFVFNIKYTVHPFLFNLLLLFFFS